MGAKLADQLDTKLVALFGCSGTGPEYIDYGADEVLVLPPSLRNNHSAAMYQL